MCTHHSLIPAIISSWDRFGAHCSGTMSSCLCTDTWLSNKSDPLLIQAPVHASSPCSCSPFPPPHGTVAFMASNYRLYQSYISPYISADLKGQLIALWQACAWPLKEKSRSGRSKPNPQSSIYTSGTNTHVHTFVPVSHPDCPFCLLPGFNLVSFISPEFFLLLCHHTCHFKEQRGTKCVFVHIMCLCTWH